MKKKEKLKSVAPGCGCNDKRAIGGLQGPILPAGNGPVNKLHGTYFCFDTRPSPFGYLDYKCDWDVAGDDGGVIAHGHSH